MSEPFLGEIKIVSFNFPPRFWAFCNGQLLSISQNQALFSILGTTYGGNGTTNFALPNLQGRAPLHMGTGGGGSYVQGQTAGETAHTLTVAELPSHTHGAAAGTAPPDLGNPTAGHWAPNEGAYAGTAAGTMASQAIGSSGGGQPHTNQPPYLVLNFCIALSGIYPSQS